MSRISEEHLKQWHDHGYVIVEDFLTPKELVAAQKRTQPHLPQQSGVRVGSLALP
jgi:hypothetical protein